MKTFLKVAGGLARFCEPLHAPGFWMLLRYSALMLLLCFLRNTISFASWQYENIYSPLHKRETIFPNGMAIYLPQWALYMSIPTKQYHNKKLNGSIKRSC